MTTQANTGIARRRANLRRAVIAVLVVVSLVLFTAYFRESDSGPLHGLQDAAASVIAPVQGAARRATEPFRDAWGWFSDLRGARGRAEALEEENRLLLAEAIERREQAEEVARLRGLAGLGAGLAADYTRITGVIDGRSVTNWYKRARIDVGSDEGVVVNSPVVASGEGAGAEGSLVGLITRVGGGWSEVSFITDGRTEVGASVQGTGSPPGIISSTNPGQLQLSQIPREFKVEEGQAVVTAGFVALGSPSLYPPGIPIGQVTGVGTREVDVQHTVQVTPFVDTRSLRYVVVLVPSSKRARRRAVG